MSYHALQRVVVRMLFDPAFVDQCYNDPANALIDLDLTEMERVQLLATDRRAWGYDPLRRQRTLRTLVEEFKVSTTLALAETRKLAFLDSFFSSKHFHNAVQTRASMGLAFAKFLSEACQSGQLKTAQLPDIVRVESALARCRRELTQVRANTALPQSINENVRVKLAAAHDVSAYQANTITTIQRVEQYLFEVNLMPAMVLCDDAPRLNNLPAVDTKKRLFLLVAPSANGVSLIHLERVDYLVLLEARIASTIKQLAERVAVVGVTRNKAHEVISEALELGYLEIRS